MIDANTGEGVSPVDIDLLDGTTGAIGLGPWAATTTDGQGYFRLNDIPHGDYKLFFNAEGEAQKYIDLLYEDVPCLNADCDFATQGTAINIPATSSLNVSLLNRFADQEAKEKAQLNVLTFLLMRPQPRDFSANTTSIRAAGSLAYPISFRASLGSPRSIELTLPMCSDDEGDLTYAGFELNGNVIHTGEPGSTYIFETDTLNAGAHELQAFCADRLEPDFSQFSAKESTNDMATIIVNDFSEIYPADDEITVCAYDAPIDNPNFTCQTKTFSDYGYGALDDYVVTDPDRLVVDAVARNTQLSALSETTKKLWCEVDLLSDLDLATYIEPLLPQIVTEEVNRNATSSIFRLAVFGRALYSYFDNEEARDALARSFLAWAEAGQLLDFDFARFDMLGVRLDQWYGLPAYIMAWTEIRGSAALSEPQKQQIDAWLVALGEKLTPYDSEQFGFFTVSSLDTSNQSIAQAFALMVFGVWRDDDVLFRRGIQKYFQYLDGMLRADGSPVYESQRGETALGYVLGTTALMVRIAELAAQQGYDLYSVEINGISLDTLVNFSLDSFADPTLYNQYTAARNPIYCGVCTEWDTQITTGLSVGEFELYKQRFPNSATTDKIFSVFPESQWTPVQEGPFLQTCEFRPVNQP